MWVFRKTGKKVGVWQVGYYDPCGDFISLYEFDESVDAAQQVHFLNGGN